MLKNFLFYFGVVLHHHGKESGDYYRFIIIMYFVSISVIYIIFG